MARKDSRRTTIIITIIVGILFVGTLLWLGWQSLTTPNDDADQITTFDECRSASGSRILETFPEQCVTADGRTFIGPSE